jgi:hypothetical protein
MLTFFLAWFVPAMAIITLLGATRAALAAAPILMITQGVPEATPGTVVVGQNSAMLFDVSVQNGSAGESGNGTISSQSFLVQATNSDTTISSVSVSDTTDYTVTTVTAGQEYKITGGGYSVPKFTVTVVASGDKAPESDGATLSGTLYPQSGSDADAGPMTDSFQVLKVAVDVTGDPYIVIPADGTPDSNTTSTYTGDAQGGTAPYEFQWATSADYAYTDSLDTAQHYGSESESSDQVSCYGVNPWSQGEVATVTCDAYDANDVYGWGYTQANVLPQYVDVMDTTPTLVYGDWTELTPTQTEPLSGGVPLSWTVTGSVSATIGVTVSGGFDAGFVAAQIGGDVATTVTLTISATATVNYPVPGQEYAEWGRTKRDDLEGTETQWGPGGVVKTGQINDWSWANGDYNLELGGGNTPPPS